MLWNRIKHVVVHPINLLVLLVITCININCAVNRNQAVTKIDSNPDVIMETLDPSLLQYEHFWKAEIARRFHNAVGVFIHGTMLPNGEWVSLTEYVDSKTYTPVKLLVRDYQRMYPHRTIVLVSCNPGHVRLDVPGIYYVHSSVWCIPDRALKLSDFQRFDNATFSTINDVLDAPHTKPSTQPSTPQILPLSSLPGVPEWLPTPIPARAVRPPGKTRWETDPDVIGNIFEFQAD